MTEFDLHREAVQILRSHARLDIAWWHTPNGEKRDRRTGAKVQAMGAKAGVGDLSLLVDGAYHEVELKTGTGRISADQLRRAEDLQRAGGEMHFVRSLREFIDILQRVGALRTPSRDLDACGGRGVRIGEGASSSSPNLSPSRTGAPA